MKCCLLCCCGLFNVLLLRHYNSCASVFSTGISNNCNKSEDNDGYDDADDDDEKAEQDKDTAPSIGTNSH